MPLEPSASVMILPKGGSIPAFTNASATGSPSGSSTSPCTLPPAPGSTMRTEIFAPAPAVIE